MSIEITHVRYGSTARGHESIVRYKWTGIETNQVGDSDKPTLVEWIEAQNGRAVVGKSPNRVPVGVVRPSTGQPYLRTYADGKWTDNLLSLPTF